MHGDFDIQFQFDFHRIGRSKKKYMKVKQIQKLVWSFPFSLSVFDIKKQSLSWKNGAIKFRSKYLHFEIGMQTSNRLASRYGVAFVAKKMRKRETYQAKNTRRFVWIGDKWKMVNRIIAGWRKKEDRKTRPPQRWFYFHFNGLTDQSMALKKNSMRSWQLVRSIVMIALHLFVRWIDHMCTQCAHHV